MTNYKINSIMVQFLDKDGQIFDTAKTSFVVKPICSKKENVWKTAEDNINKKLSCNKYDLCFKAKKIITVSTNKGKFILATTKTKVFFKTY